jgi:hypothetical protein
MQPQGGHHRLLKVNAKNNNKIPQRDAPPEFNFSIFKYQ